MKKILMFMLLFFACLFVAPTTEAQAKKKPVKLNKKSVNIVMEKTFHLKVSNTKKVKWSSSDKSIATVGKKGKIVAKNLGECKITAKAAGKTYTCKVKVTKGLSEKNIVLPQTCYYKLELRGYGEVLEEEITFETSNDKVVSVDERGVLKAGKRGTAKIKVTYGDKVYNANVRVTKYSGRKYEPTYGVYCFEKSDFRFYHNIEASNISWIWDVNNNNWEFCSNPSSMNSEKYAKELKKYAKKVFPKPDHEGELILVKETENGETYRAEMTDLILVCFYFNDYK